MAIEKKNGGSGVRQDSKLEKSGKTCSAEKHLGGGGQSREAGTRAGNAGGTD